MDSVMLTKICVAASVFVVCWYVHRMGIAFMEGCRDAIREHNERNAREGRW